MIRRLLVLLAVFAATAIGTVVVSAPSAQALPYPPVIRIPIITASAYDPCAGASNIIGGRGFQPGETVVLVLAKTGEIGRVVVAADTTFQITVTIPLSARGSNQVTATGLTSGRRAILTLEVPCVANDGSTGGNGGSGNGGTGNGGSSGDDAASDSAGFGSGGVLASTGAAIGGAILLGGVLFAVGGVLTVAGRRRRGTSH